MGHIEHKEIFSNIQLKIRKQPRHLEVQIYDIDYDFDDPYLYNSQGCVELLIEKHECDEFIKMIERIKESLINYRNEK